MYSILGILGVLYIGLFLYSLKYRNNSIVDVFWGIVPAFIALWSYLFESYFTLSQTLVTLLVLAWGLRLFLNIFAKKIGDFHKEDHRYGTWRKQWTWVKTRSFFQVFLFQLILACGVATPIWFVNFSVPWDENIFLTFLGASIALFGLMYEDRADGELAGFIKNKKHGDIFTSGLRKFHRYPQYFGEATFWFGICLIAAGVSLWSFGGFVIVFILVRYVSGVPMLEKHYAGQRNFEMYAKKTPIFLPDYSLIFSKK